MKLLVDMNLTARWTTYLTNAGWESVHWSAIGAPNATDASICQWARTNKFVILTNDLDFPQILAHTRGNGPSVVLLRGEPLTPEVRGESLIKGLRSCEQELQNGAIATIDWDDKLRVRLLPLV